MEESNGVVSNSEDREKNDLDNIRTGTPGKGGAISLYFNCREDTDEELRVLVDRAINMLKYANDSL